MIRVQGTTVVLYERRITGEDEFHAPVCEYDQVTVDNVLVCPVDASDVETDLQIYGKRAEYALCIPKDDTHQWEDAKVAFFGQTWRTFGFAQEWIQENVPGPWNKRIKVERYG